MQEKDDMELMLREKFLELYQRYKYSYGLDIKVDMFLNIISCILRNNFTEREYVSIDKVKEDIVEPLVFVEGEYSNVGLSQYSDILCGQMTMTLTLTHNHTNSSAPSSGDINFFLRQGPLIDMVVFGSIINTLYYLRKTKDTTVINVAEVDSICERYLELIRISARELLNIRYSGNSTNLNAQLDMAKAESMYYTLNVQAFHDAFSRFCDTVICEYMNYYIGDGEKYGIS